MRPNSLRHYLSALLFLIALAGFTATGDLRAQDLASLESEVADIFNQSCARVGCHAGSDPQMGMSLERGLFFDHTVGVSSRERGDLQLVDPGRPDSSYLVMKVRGDESIVGAPMPMTGGSLSEDEISTIVSWVDALGEADLSDRLEGAAPKTASAFVGWKVVNVPTTRMVDAKRWLFLISHRFNPELSSGYDSFWGLDGSGIIFLGMGYAPTDNLLISLARSNASDDVELEGKLRLLQQMVGQGAPLSLAARAAVNWITEEAGNVDRFDAEAFKFSGQIIAAHEVASGIGVLTAPGVLLNQDSEQSGEDLLFTVGLGGRWQFHRNLSLLAEWVPIVYGYERTTTFGNENRFDSWGTGLEIAVGGHVFQIVLSNSVGLTTDQYMRGGDLDIEHGDVRLGFNIFRILRF